MTLLMADGTLSASFTLHSGTGLSPGIGDEPASADTLLHYATPMLQTCMAGHADTRSHTHDGREMLIVVVFALREDCKTPQPASCGLGGSSAGLKA
jgi:hypothetical protein